jgi:hypothetical protein
VNSQVFDQFLEDFKADADPTIGVNLAKDPAD